MIAEYAANLTFGYLLGSVPAGLVIGYLWLRKDIRTMGSGKTGTTNVLRTAGRVAALLTVLLDPLKGLAPALVGRFVFDDQGVAAAGAAAAIAGHVWPVFAGFRGGRGVATAFGGALGLFPLWAPLFLLAAGVVLAVSRYVSLMSVLGMAIGGTSVVVLAIAGVEPWASAAFAIFAVALVEYMHIPNIRRLLAGTEPKIGRGGDRTASG
ncbi:MAG: glycerol-3-phosphate 1-O-acyltransferase PlsY [Dehalococcoidia bacterium]